MSVTGDGAVVIVGAGQAGATLATSLRERGWRGGIVLVGAEDRIPYQRPPLSKGYLLGTETDADLVLCAPVVLERDDIRYLAGCRVVRLDTDAHVAVLDDGATLPYAAAVLATGSVARRLPVPGADLRGVHALRTAEDADRLRAELVTARDVVIIGGGFIGLEFATAVPAGRSVTVVEAADRILLRAVSAPIAERLHGVHTRRGVRILTSSGIEQLREGEGGRVSGVRLSDGSELPADLVLVGVGAAPSIAVAEASALDVDGGVLIDAHLRASAPDVWAIGDCARFPNAFTGSLTRLESVQNATDQARYVAAALTGAHPEPYRALPWFWSHQGGVNLQIAGLAAPGDDAVVIEDGDALIVERVRDGVVVAVETIDSPRSHVRARRTLAAELLRQGAS